jgi:hypothetical protein
VVQFGDLIQEAKPKSLSCDEMVIYKYEYKYDENKNWIRKLTYLGDGVTAEKILQEKRTIKYRKRHT